MQERPKPHTDNSDLPIKLRFFIELADDLAIPDRGIITVFLGDRATAVNANLEIVVFGDEPIPDDRTGKEFVSLRFTRWEVDRTLRIRPAVLLVMNQLLGAGNSVRGPSGLRDGVAVVEALTLAPSTEEVDVKNAFDSCIEAMATFLRDYQARTVTVITPIQRERLQNPVPYVVGTLDQRPLWSDEGWQPDVRLHSLTAAFPAPSTPLSDVDMQTIQQLQVMRSRLVRGDPVMRCDDYRLRARRALSIDGDFDSAVVYAQMSIELFADAVLGLLMWEDKTKAEEAANALEDQNVPRKVAGRFQHILGGHWDITKGAVGAWHTDLYELRNRVIHRGHYPSQEEVRSAFKASEAFTDHLRECVYSRRNKYPRSALLVVGRPALEERGDWRGKIKRFVEFDANTEPNWIGDYATWRRAVEIARDQLPAATAGDQIVTKTWSRRAVSAWRRLF